LTLTEITTFLEDQFADQGDPVAVAPDEDLVMMGLDSIAYLRLLSWLRNEHGVTVPDEDVTLENFGSAAAIAAYVDSQAGSTP
jgi:acyl carrier protein